jgi:hypothetical protein
MRDTEIDDRYEELAERWKEISDREEGFDALFEAATDIMRQAGNCMGHNYPQIVDDQADILWEAARRAKDLAEAGRAKAWKDQEQYGADLRAFEASVEAAA